MIKRLRKLWYRLRGYVLAGITIKGIEGASVPTGCDLRAAIGPPLEDNPLARQMRQLDAQDAEWVRTQVVPK